MPLYSASQLIGKTILLDKTVNVYSVFDLNNLGDDAKPSGTMQSGQTFVIDSFLAPTSGYKSIYNITYAPRKVPYFTFYDGTIYKAIAVIADGRFSLNTLQDQGTLTVKEEIAAEQAKQDEGTFAGFFNSIGKGFGNIKGFLIPIIIILLIIFFAPVIASSLKKSKS